MNLDQPEIDNLRYQAPYKISASKHVVFWYHIAIAGIGAAFMMLEISLSILPISEWEFSELSLTVWFILTMFSLGTVILARSNYDIHVFEDYITGPSGHFILSNQFNCDLDTVGLLPPIMLLNRVLSRINHSEGRTVYIWKILYRGQSKRKLEHFLSKLKQSSIS